MRLALVLAFLLLAGCATQPATQHAQPVIIIDPNRPATEFGEVKTGAAVGPDLNATTAAAPRLIEGEWWRIQFDSKFYEGTPDVVRVVANATSEGYIFGMPHAGWFKEAIAYHAPAFGDVGLNLSYATHNVLFEPVRFPLVKGNTWNTALAASPIVATVEEADQFTATVSFASPKADPQPTDPLYQALGLSGGFNMRLVYDARQHEVVEMHSDIGSWHVIEHGYTFNGWVTVPRGEHTAIDYGTFGPAAADQPVLTRNVEVSGGFNRLTMMHLIFPLAPGAFHIKSTLPNGTSFLTEATATSGMTLKFYEASDPDGTWAQEDLVAGAAATYSMGIAYHQYDIMLPGGQRRSDHSHAVIR